MCQRTCRQWIGAAAAAFAVVLLAVPSYAGKVELPKGSKLVVAFEGNVSSSVFAVGDSLPIVLQEDVTVGGLVLVEKGARGTAVVAKAEKSGRAGKPGMIAVIFVDLKPKGQYPLLDVPAIALEGGTNELKGKGKKVLSYLFIFGLFIKGGEGKVPAGSTFEATVAESVKFEVQ
ncbi:MAG TPA: hypothetical protein PKW75_04650 [candidate division Zixibacteria bacterium]|nr:hypothetical protein [candidate division Zixibacteria bacterium]MDD4916505.1 hypothetical protein [candidate division Zixibacteria bacterium]MDM7972095.1 hypothetical protein [candidate division Zixibacteria bacterium]HOD65070.1 hypothetical protein [candidate division Zixibacteria bacterium]HOZ07557.1 hypothetical protein [candidate division Zixibacteria bacterium]